MKDQKLLDISFVVTRITKAKLLINFCFLFWKNKIVINIRFELFCGRNVFRKMFESRLNLSLLLFVVDDF